MSASTLRPYQRDAITAANEAFARARRVLVVMATGLGKTVCFAKLAEHWRPHGRVLVLAHREELIRQAQDKIAAWTGLSTAVEMADERADSLWGQRADVVVASIQTLARTARLERFDPAVFSLVVVDECHHAPSDSYQRVLGHFASARILGLTATPDRLDKKALGKTFDEAAFIYELRDAIADGWLAKIRQRRAQIEGLDLGAVRTTAGDFNEGDLESAMMRGPVLHGVAKAVVESAGERKTLVFAATVAHAHAIAAAMGHLADPARILVLSGQDSRENRRAGLDRFRAGDVQYLVNCMLLGEGFDEPRVECVAVARPTKSRALYAQMAGRSTRLWCPHGCPARCDHPDAKRDALLVDIAGNSGRHTLINAFDVLGGGAEDPEIRQRAERIAAGGQTDISEALARAREELAEFHRRQALEAAKRAATEVRVRYTDVDPFAVLGVPPTKGLWGGIEATEAQLDELRHHKVDRDIPLVGLDRGQAAALLRAIKDRPRKGQCTYRMARVLARYGLNPDLRFEEASAAMGLLETNGWKLTAEIVSRFSLKPTTPPAEPAAATA